MGKDGYVRIPIPQELVERIDAYMRKKKGRYKKRTEVVREALDYFLSQFEEEE